MCQGVLILDYNVVAIVNARVASLVLLGHKEDVTTQGEEERQIMPVARDSKMYFSMASLSGRDRLYS